MKIFWIFIRICVHIFLHRLLIHYRYIFRHHFVGFLLCKHNLVCRSKLEMVHIVRFFSHRNYYIVVDILVHIHSTLDFHHMLLRWEESIFSNIIYLIFKLFCWILYSLWFISFGAAHTQATIANAKITIEILAIFVFTDNFCLNKIRIKEMLWHNKLAYWYKPLATHRLFIQNLIYILLYHYLIHFICIQ